MVEISNILKKKFAAVNKQEKKQPDNTVYGSVYVDSGGQVYVTIDGSEERTPATTTMEVFTGDRIIGEVKDHKLIITGNLTKPTDQTRPELEDLEEVVNGIGEAIEAIEEGIKYVVSVIPQWCLATARVIPEGEEFEDIQADGYDWEDELPEMPSTGTYFYWTRNLITYSDGSTDTTEPKFDMGAQVGYEASKAADAASDAADEAEQIANGKAATFVGSTTPTDPVEGDIWFKSVTDPLYVYHNNAWTKLDNYTDDSSLTTFINGAYSTAISSLQNQIDGNITTWFYGYVPTLNNVPASSWNTEALKNEHLGDLFYDTSTGYCYRFMVENSTYSWQRITDTDVTKALSDAAEAKDVADGKRRIFTSTPTPPYDVGDLWTQGSNGDIKVCTTPKTDSGSYAASDWVVASKYTDDSTVNALKNHFWYDNAGAHVAENSVNPLTTGASLTMASTGILQRYNGKVVNSYTNGALNFYDDRALTGGLTLADTILASYSRSGMTLYGQNGSDASNVRLASFTGSGVTFWDPTDTSSSQRYEAIFAPTGILFNPEIPFTIGNNSSYIKWIYDSTTQQWKIDIAADVLTIGGTTPAADSGQISDTTTHLLAINSSSGVTKYTSGWDTYTTVSESRPYLWSYTEYKNSSGTVLSTTSPVIIGKYGETGRGILDTEIRYASSTSGTTIPSSFTATSPPSVAAGSYLWTRVRFQYTDYSYSDPEYSVAKQGVDVTSIYMAFDSDATNGGLFIYSGDKTDSTKKKYYTRINTNGFHIAYNSNEIVHFDLSNNYSTISSAYTLSIESRNSIRSQVGNTVLLVASDRVSVQNKYLEAYQYRGFGNVPLFKVVSTEQTPSSFTGDKTIQFAPTTISGYYPVGVLGWDLDGNGSGSTYVSYCNVFACYYDSSTGKINVQIRNMHSSGSANIIVKVYVLYRDQTMSWSVSV